MSDSQNSATTTPSLEIFGERIKENERKRIAKDLHDELGSQLTAIKMALTQLTLQLPESAQSLQDQARYTDQLVDGAFKAMHDIIDDLYPAILDLGLAVALEWLLQSYARQNQITYRLNRCDKSCAELLDAFQSVSLYRITQEALHNASRHAAASLISVELYRDQSEIVLDIMDDGIGLAAPAINDAQCSGIRGMEQRAASIGARFALFTPPDSGVHIQIRTPVPTETKLVK